MWYRKKRTQQARSGEGWLDYRKLNEKTVGDAYPLPDVTEILDQLGQNKYFPCIDMVMGSHQIEMAEDRAKTAFSTRGLLGI